MEDLKETQKKFEKEMVKTGINRWHKNHSDSAINLLESQVIQPIAAAITEFVETHTAKTAAQPLLAQIDTMTAAYIALKTCMIVKIKEEILVATVMKIGRNIENEITYSSIAEKDPEIKKRLENKIKKSRFSLSPEAIKKIYDDAIGRVTPSSWSDNDRIHVGSALLEIVVDCCKINNAPVFEVKYKTREGKTFNYLTKTDAYAAWEEKYIAINSITAPDFRPLVIPPVPWTSPVNGGYHDPAFCGARKLTLIKSSLSNLKANTYDQMPAVYDAVNALQRVKWQVNTDILATAKLIKGNDLGIAFPKASSDRIKPSNPLKEKYDVKYSGLKDVCSDEEYQEFISFCKESKEFYDTEKILTSKRYAALDALATAEKYSNYPLYFVYTLDFRGRVYAKSSGVNPQGNDLQKALIKFFDGKPLGDEGRNWLYIHGANTFGNDKISLADRVLFIESIQADIIDYASDPVNNQGWVGADKPWQFLAFCYEFKALNDHTNAGLPASEFISYLPVAMDGSCSGIQHYSASLRDSVGAGLVNLQPGEKPNDIYQGVADSTLSKLTALADSGDEISAGLLAVPGLICRKLCKPPVMTKTYGSTFIRCYHTTCEFADKLAEKGVPVWSEDADTAKAQKVLLAKTIWAATNENTTGAVVAMKYVQDIASMLAKENKTLRWTTPTGMVVEQRSFVKNVIKIKTSLFGRTDFTVHSDSKRVNASKLRSGSAPNFVHSLDASHLVMVVNRCQNIDVTDVAVVHDSFGAHACNVGALNKALRETFVELYSNDVIANFRDDAQKLTSVDLDSIEGLEKPAMGTFDLSSVLDSEYAFS